MSRHYVKPNHKFVAVNKDNAYAIYSAQHLGRVEGWLRRNDKLSEEIEILTKEEFYARQNEVVDIEFICPHDGETKKTTIQRFEIGTCTDPRTDRYWVM